MEIAINNESLPTKYGEKIDVALGEFREATKALKVNLVKSAKAELARCTALADMDSGCEEYGRPSFSWLVEHEIGMDKSNASQMKKIGYDKKCSNFTTLLPASISAMKEVRMMTDSQAQEAADLYYATKDDLLPQGMHPGQSPAYLKKFREGTLGVVTPKKPKAPTTIDGDSIELIDMEPEEIMALLSDLTDVIPASVRESASDHNNPEFFAAKSLAVEHGVLMKALKPLSRKEGGRVVASLVKVLAHNQRVFDYVLKTEKPRALKAREESLKTQIADVKERRKKLVAGKVAVDEHGLQVMLRSDFKRFLGALHPDKHIGSEEKYQKLFNDFKEYEDMYRA